MPTEQIMAVVASVMALVICIGGLRGARRWEREDRRLREPEKKRERAEGSGPWGG